MSITSKKSLLSLMPARVPKILEIGRENHMQSVNGKLCLATVCTKIIYRVLRIHANPDVKAYLQNNGGTLFDLIDRGVHKIISDEKP